MKRPRLIDVAEAAGVSVKTASRVINQERWVSDETRRKVAAAIERLQFRPNFGARALAGSRSFMVALIYDTIAPSEVGAVLAGAIKRCRLADYHVVVDQVTTVSPDVGDHVAQLLKTTDLDGVILAAPVCDSAAVMDVLEGADMPYVRMLPYIDLDRSPYISINDFRAAFEATSHLLGLGHRDIAFIKGDWTHGSARARYDGFVAAMRHANCAVAPERVLQGDYTFGSGSAALDRLAHQSSMPTAIFASNDGMALGVCAAARARGWSVPKDLSVLGFDDTAQNAQPALTTVRQPFVDVATAAADCLIKLAEGMGNQLGRATLLDHEFIVRDSTAEPRSRPLASTSRALKI